MRGKIKGHFKTKKGLILGLLILLVLGLAVSIALVQQPQILKKFARVPETGIATCRWQTASDVSSYRYVITNQATGEVVSRGETQATTVDFEVTFGDAYSCAVFGVNECGVGPQSRTSDICRLDVTPTPTSTPTPTPSITSTPTATPIHTPTPTIPGQPTITPTLTPTETPVPSGTPVPTPTFQPTATPIPTATTEPAATPTPLAEELPESGFFVPTYLIFLAGFILTLGGAVLLRIL